jgi:hypothetical protein
MRHIMVRMHRTGAINSVSNSIQSITPFACHVASSPALFNCGALLALQWASSAVFLVSLVSFCVRDSCAPVCSAFEWYGH